MSCFPASAIPFVKIVSILKAHRCPVSLPFRIRAKEALEGFIRDFGLVKPESADSHFLVRLFVLPVILAVRAPHFECPRPNPNHGPAVPRSPSLTSCRCVRLWIGFRRSWSRVARFGQVR